jgi:ABC-type Fe3+ transport system permease subunit
VVLPAQLPLLLAAAVAVAVLSAGEIGAAQLVVPPGVNSLARTMLNEIHFGRSNDIIALALWQMGIGAAAAGLLARPLRRRMRYENPDHQR